ncbi:MAG: hydroxymethylbilane synthase [Candidatus Omnitrophota bacterium]|nr:hydroxymethylbilane synthase [Candidatus Omnitrophota bacterium]
MMTVRVGSRPSSLAIKQVEEIGSRMRSVNFEVVRIETAGDRDKTTPLSEIKKSDFFSGDIEQALLSGSIDAGIHSAKDLGDNIPAGLTIAAITSSLSSFECLVSRGGLSLKDLPRGAVVGTSSAKRKEAIARFRPDLVTKDLRGEIDERLKQLDENKFDALIIAHAALIRLGYEHRIAQVIPKEIMEPHPLQGALAVEVRQNDLELIKLFSDLDTRKAGKHARS